MNGKTKRTMKLTLNQLAANELNDTSYINRCIFKIDAAFSFFFNWNEGQGKFSFHRHNNYHSF